MSLGGVPIIQKILIFIAIISLAGCQVQIDPRDIVSAGPGPDPDSPLISTHWSWDSGWAGESLSFEDAETVIYTEGISLSYSYNKETRKGQVDTLGNFTVTENYEEMYFPAWKQFPHGADFTRVNN